MIGPLPFLSGGYGVSMMRPVYVSRAFNLSDPTMGLNWRPGWVNAITNLWPASNPTEQPWGQIIMNINFGHVMDGTDPDLSSLAVAGYSYSLWQNGKFTTLLNASVPRVDITNLTDAGVLARLDPVTVSFDVVDGNTW